MKRIALFVAAVALTQSAFAQTAPAAPPPPMPQRDPMLLPGDNPPPPPMPMAGQPRGPAFRPPAPRAKVAGPDLATALAAAQAALAKCKADGLNVGVAVADSEGNLLVGLTMDGANPGRIFTASRKNLVVTAFRTPSSAVQDRLRANDAAAQAMIKPNMITFAGAVPLVIGGQFVGAIGVSGAASQQDEACAAAGAAKVRS